MVAVDLAKRWPRVLDHALVTGHEILAGFLLAIVVSIPLALAIAYSRLVERSAYPVIVFLQIVPKIAIAPLFIIWFGFGFTPKLLLVFLLSFFPIVVSSIAGFKSLDPDVTDLARSTGANRAEDVPQDPAPAGTAADLHRNEGRRRAVCDCRGGRRVRRLGQGARLPASRVQRQPRNADGLRRSSSSSACSVCSSTTPSN